MFRRGKNSGQSAIEYTVILIIAIGAFLAMGQYMKRAVQGGWKAAVDPLGEQYNPKESWSNIEHTIESNTIVSVQSYQNATTQKMQTLRFDSTNSIETKEGSSHIRAEY